MVRLPDRLLRNERLNFALTNRVPRHALTRFMGWYSRLRQPWLVRPSLALWRLFDEVDLSDARESRFESLHAVFTRELRAGARPIDPRPEVLASPCDGIVGACGAIAQGLVLQAKNMPYRLQDLLGDAGRATTFDGGRYVTLRLRSGMYHRFHAPAAARIEHVSYFGGDTWNVNPATLKRIPALYCRNERAMIRLRLDGGGEPLVLVPVAAILVASLRLHCLSERLHRGRQGPHEIPCAATVDKGQELGWFEHGSTIIVLVPAGFALAPGVEWGRRLRMGEPLLLRSRPAASAA